MKYTLGKRKKRKSSSRKTSSKSKTKKTNEQYEEVEVPNVEELLQAELNIGTIGHVDHGKSTLVQALTGKFPDTHSEELRRGITIRLGYADCELRFCELEHDEKNYNGYTTKKYCPIHKDHETQLLRRISFVDAPGHEVLMATMLSGAAIMDGVVLVISATEKVPMPQTREHLAAMNAIGMDKIIVVQNKIELVTEQEAESNFNDIMSFIEKEATKIVAKDTDIIPISAIHGTNVDILVESMIEKFPRPERNTSSSPNMSIARSFDINKPGKEIDQWIGGIVGGVINEGIFRTDDEIEILPGLRNKNKWQKIEGEIVSLQSGFGRIEQAFPGGLIGVGTGLDPSITKNDKLVGHVVGKPGELPPVWNQIDFNAVFMDRVVGAKVDREMDSKSIVKGTKLMLNIGTAKTVGILDTAIHHKDHTEMSLNLALPVCAKLDARIAISHFIDHRWRLVGWGSVLGGKELEY